MIVPRIDCIQPRIRQQARTADAAVAEAAADVPHRILQPVAPLVCIREHTDLLVAALHLQTGHAHAQAADGPIPAVSFPEQRLRMRRDVPGERRGRGDLPLTGQAVQLAVAHV